VAVSNPSVFVTTFLASAVEVIEMVIIIVGVGTVRGWRSTWLGAGAGLAVLAVLVLVFGTALQAVPIDTLRLVIGSLLLVFGLQWLRKGIRRVAAHGFRGMGDWSASAEGIPAHGVDWTAFLLSFKGVLLEGLEVAFIVVSFGLTAQALGSAVAGAAAAFAVIAVAGVLTHNVVQRIPRSALQLLVGTLLSSFGTFWAVEGLGVAWPADDLAILALIGWYALAAAGYTTLLRRRAHPLLAQPSQG
jgi:Ca2+/H+ antiporter, TMEM165/GDT1 family